MHTHICGQKRIIPPAEFIRIYNFLLYQTQKDIRGKLRVGSKERLTFFGQVRLNSLHSIHREVKVKGNFSHQLEVNKNNTKQTKTTEPPSMVQRCYRC